MSKSNWIVITGGPSSGKKTVFKLLEKMGYPVVKEVARGVIDRANRQGISTEELRKDEVKFQLSLIPIKAELERRLPRQKKYFLNRAMPDGVAYLRHCGGDPDVALIFCEKGLYKRVYLLEQLPQFQQDYARIESLEEARRINRLLYEAYSELGYEVIRIPVMPPDERVRFILSQMSDFRIGLSTSAWDEVAWDLVKEVSQNFPVAFVFVSREEGETRYGDLMIKNVREAKLPLITFSSMRFKPELRREDQEAWRLEHDREVMKLLPPTDLIVLLGYMWWFGKEMCQKKVAINLHPALPAGPKGTYRDVIWQLIKEGATETGVMMHLVTPELDRGPVISFCRFPIGSSDFDSIRQKGVIREFPMVIWTIKILAEGRIKIENGQVIDSRGQVLRGGYDLTEEIDAIVKEQKRG